MNHATQPTVTFTLEYGRGQNYAKGSDHFGEYEVIGTRRPPEHVRRIAQACSEFIEEFPNWGDDRALSLLKLVSTKYSVDKNRIAKILNFSSNESYKSKKKRKSSTKSKKVRRKSKAA